MEEVWRECIPGYEVSNKGRVRSPRRVLALHDINGYLRIGLNKRPYRVHRLVAQAFIPNDNPLKTCVNHKDGNKRNNCVENLEWVTDRENMLHYHKLRREQGHTLRRQVALVITDTETGEKLRFDSIAHASQAFDIDVSSMWSYSLAGKFWGHYTIERIEIVP